MTDALKVSIEGDSGKLISALQQSANATTQFAKRAEASVSTLNQRFTHLRNLVVGVFSFRAVRQLSNWVSETVQAQDELGKFADRVGISVEGLSRLQYAAELSGISVESLRQGLQRATRRMAEFATTGKGEAATAIKELGLEYAVKQGQTFEQILPKIAEGFRNIGDQGQRVRLSQKLFDSEGVSFIQLLQQGPEALRALGAEADRLGITLTKADTDRAAALVDAATRLERASDGLANAIVRLTGSPLARYLNDLTDGLLFLTGGVSSSGDIEVAPRYQRAFELEQQIKTFERSIRRTGGGFAGDKARLEDLQANLAAAREELAKLNAELNRQPTSYLDSNADFRLPRSVVDESRRQTEAKRQKEAQVIKDLFGSPGRTGDFPDPPGFADGIRSGAQRVGELANSFRLAEDAVYSFGTGVAGSLGETFTDVITGAQSGSAAIQAFGRSVISTFVEISARAAAFKLVGSLFGAVSAPAANGVTPLTETSNYVDPLSFGGAFKPGAGAPSGTGTTIVINVQATGTSPADIVRAVQTILPELAQAVEYQNSRSSTVKRPAA